MHCLYGPLVVSAKFHLAYDKKLSQMLDIIFNQTNLSCYTKAIMLILASDHFS